MQHPGGSGSFPPPLDLAALRTRATHSTALATENLGFPGPREELVSTYHYALTSSSIT